MAVIWTTPTTLTVLLVLKQVNLLVHLILQASKSYITRYASSPPNEGACRIALHIIYNIPSIVDLLYMRILVIEDNQKLADSITRGLRQEGYAADYLTNGLEGEKRMIMSHGDYDVLILDR